MISELLARNQISIKLDWTYDYYSLKYRNQYKMRRVFI
jgi:hypothetical protein